MSLLRKLIDWWLEQPVYVYVARDAEGRPLGVFSSGPNGKARALRITVLPLQEWCVDGPEYGPMVDARDVPVDKSKPA